MNNKDGWFGVELRHLAALAAIAREGSFRGAADSLGYVQSAVSQRIVQLERLIGVRLVDRTRGSKEVQVTPLGQLLVEHAEEILGRVQAARADLASHSDADRQDTLRVGVSPSVADGLLPSVLRALAAEFPELRLCPAESASDAALCELVEQGEADVAFGELPLPSGPFTSRTILRDRSPAGRPAVGRENRGDRPRGSRPGAPPGDLLARRAGARRRARRLLRCNEQNRGRSGTANRARRGVARGIGPQTSTTTGSTIGRRRRRSYTNSARSS